MAKPSIVYWIGKESRRRKTIDQYRNCFQFRAIDKSQSQIENEAVKKVNYRYQKIRY